MEFEGMKNLHSGSPRLELYQFSNQTSDEEFWFAFTDFSRA